MGQREIFSILVTEGATSFRLVIFGKNKSLSISSNHGEVVQLWQKLRMRSCSYSRDPGRGHAAVTNDLGRKKPEKLILGFSCIAIISTVPESVDHFTARVNFGKRQTL